MDASDDNSLPASRKFSLPGKTIHVVQSMQELERLKRTVSAPNIEVVHHGTPEHVHSYKLVSYPFPLTMTRSRL
jgi:hypothetical protein